MFEQFKQQYAATLRRAAVLDAAVVQTNSWGADYRAKHSKAKLRRARMLLMTRRSMADAEALRLRREMARFAPAGADMSVPSHWTYQPSPTDARAEVDKAVYEVA